MWPSSSSVPTETISARICPSSVPSPVRLLACSPERAGRSGTARSAATRRGSVFQGDLLPLALGAVDGQAEGQRGPPRLAGDARVAPLLDRPQELLVLRPDGGVDPRL